MSDSDNDINDDRFQEMGQVMTGISGRMDELASPCDFQFDLHEAFKKLSIATKEPSDENLEALEATFGDLGQLIKILLSKKHTAEEAAILLAAGMRSTKTSIDNDMNDHKEGVRRVHNGHFLNIKEIFRRLSVVEGRRQAFPTFAQDPEQPLPSPTILEELDGIQASLHDLQQRDNLTPYFNKIRADLTEFKSDARQQLKRQHVTMQKQGNEREHMRVQLKKKDQRIDELGAKVQRQDQMLDRIKCSTGWRSR